MRRLLTHARPDIVGAGLVLVCGAFLVIKSPEYGIRSGNVIGPGFMPFWFGIALLVFGISVVVGALLRAHRAGADEGAEPVGGAAELSVSEPAVVPAPPDSDRAPASDDAQHSSEAATVPGPSSPPSASRGRFMKVAAVFACTVIAVALLPVLGALVAFGLLIFVLLLVVERERWWLSAVISVSVMYVLYLLFLGVLRIPLPTGPWGF